MGFPALWSKLFRTKIKAPADPPASAVLLLREFRFLNADELRSAGMAAWGIDFDGEADPMYFVVQQETVTFLKAGSFLCNLLQASKPYGLDEDWLVRLLPQEEKRRIWQQHTAWLAIDSLDRKADRTETYAAIARLAEQLLDGNCAAIYFPELGYFMPNDGTAVQGLTLLRDGKLSVEKNPST